MADEKLMTLEEAREVLSDPEPHYYCEDTYYSCPMHTEGCANDMEDECCTCGADDDNARNTRLLALLDALAAEVARLSDATAEVARLQMAGDDLVREGQRALHGPYFEGDPRLEEYDLALAQWEVVRGG